MRVYAFTAVETGFACWPQDNRDEFSVVTVEQVVLFGSMPGR